MLLGSGALASAQSGLPSDYAERLAEALHTRLMPLPTPTGLGWFFLPFALG